MEGESHGGKCCLSFGKVAIGEGLQCEQQPKHKLWKWLHSSGGLPLFSGAKVMQKSHITFHCEQALVLNIS